MSPLLRQDGDGIRREIIDPEELDIPGFVENPPGRCCPCKKAIFGKILEFAQANGLDAVLEGPNIDDDGDCRPGRRAMRELGRDLQGITRGSPPVNRVGRRPIDFSTVFLV